MSIIYARLDPKKTALVVLVAVKRRNVLKDTKGTIQILVVLTLTSVNVELTIALPTLLASTHKVRSRVFAIMETSQVKVATPARISMSVNLELTIALPTLRAPTHH